MSGGASLAFGAGGQYPATASVSATSESYTYDGDGNVLTRTTRTTRKGDMISFGYDTLNRMTSKTEPSGTPSVSYGYDLVGHLLSVSDNGPALPSASQGLSLAASASYDALDRPTTVSWTPTASQTLPAAAATTSPASVIARC